MYDDSFFEKLPTPWATESRERPRMRYRSVLSRKYQRMKHIESMLPTTQPLIADVGTTVEIVSSEKVELAILDLRADMPRMLSDLWF